MATESHTYRHNKDIPIITKEKVTKMKNRRYKLYFPLLAFVFMVIVTLACGSSTSTSEPKVSTATTEAEVAEPSADTEEPIAPTDTLPPPATETPVPELYLGDAVSNFGYALTGIAVQDPATPGMLYTATSGKKLIAVAVIISNISGDMISINPLSATLLDTEGFAYTSELGGVDYQMPLLDIAPGEKARGLLAFEVPENAVAGSIKYAIEMFGNQILQASLSPAPEGHVAIPEPPSTVGDPLPLLGDVVENYGYSLSAVSVEDPAPPGILYTSRQGYKLVAIEIVLGNVSGTEPLSINPLYAYLVDSNGFVYSAELAGRDGQIDTVELATGEKVQGWVAFTIPENAAPASIKYSTKPFVGNYLETGVTK